MEPAPHGSVRGEELPPVPADARHDEASVGLVGDEEMADGEEDLGRAALDVAGVGVSLSVELEVERIQPRSMNGVGRRGAQESLSCDQSVALVVVAPEAAEQTGGA